MGRQPGHFINCQAVCNHNLKFIDAVVRGPGSVHDSTIWDNSGIKSQLETFLQKMPSNYKGWLIGDSGYAQRAEMMVPFIECSTAAEEAYNVSHKRTRNKIERAFGVMKSRFRCLCKETGGAISFDVDSACAIIMASFVLHNYCMDRTFPSMLGRM